MKFAFVIMQSGLKRSGKSCRLRWLNYLRPDIKRGNMSPEEDDLIIRLHKLLGNRYINICFVCGCVGVFFFFFVIILMDYIRNSSREFMRDCCSTLFRSDDRFV